MAQRGRKPKPTALKLLEGNAGKRPINENEPRPLMVAPPCPSWLLGEARAEWERMARQLEDLGLLTAVDMAAFAGYCQAYARWKEAEEYITKNGATVTTPSGYVQQVPQVSIAQTYLKLMGRFCVEFGMTPSARSRTSSGGGSKDKEDPMEQLLGGGGSV